MKVKVVWRSGNQWKIHYKMCWTETYCFDGGRGTHLEECEVGWILTERSELPEKSHVFRMKVKRRVLYTSRRKHLQPKRGRKGKVFRILHRQAGGVTNGSRNLVLLYREGGEISTMVFKLLASRKLRTFFDVKVGGVTV